MSHFAANRFALLSDDSGSFAAKPAPKAAPAVEAAPAAAPKPRGNRASGPRTGARTSSPLPRLCGVLLFPHFRHASFARSSSLPPLRPGISAMTTTCRELSCVALSLSLS